MRLATVTAELARLRAATPLLWRRCSVVASNVLWKTRTRRYVVASVALALAGASAIFVTIGFDVARAAVEITPGVPVPAAYLPTVVTASSSCPVLSPPRLAGQLMAESGFNPDATTSDGGQGIAGLTDELWKQWAPSPTAQRNDPKANIIALAHRMCHLVGELRVAKSTSDLWRAALAAHHSGLAAVAAAGGVPDEAAGYVDLVAGYAAWYALQPEFGGPGVPSPSPSEESAAPVVEAAIAASGSPARVPDNYVAPILAAGQICPAVTPPLVAAQLMAESGFNPNMLGTNGAEGITQFLPSLWSQYARSATDSPWNPDLAIPTMGAAMCDLIKQLSGLSGDLYPIAVAAYQWGPDAVRSFGGVPSVPGLVDFILTVANDATFYAQDPRLALPTPTPTPSPTPTPTPSPTPTPTPSNSTSQPAPSPSLSVLAGHAGPIVDTDTTGWCVDVRYGDPANGTPLLMWECHGGDNQQWSFRPDGTIRSLGKCMTVEGGASAGGTGIVLSDCGADDSQKWRVTSDGWVVNQGSGKCLWNSIAQPQQHGQQLTIESCRADTINNQWRLP